MKKLSLMLACILAAAALCACGHEHTWTEATCTEPKTCSECGETEGDPLGHIWEEATCTKPKTCSRCGATEGQALGHTWEEATCVKPKTCSRCGATEGQALGHQAGEATCTEPSVCAVCGEILEEAKGHTWKKATFTKPKTCSVCGETEGDPLVPQYFGMSFTQYKNAFNKKYKGKMKIVPVKGSGIYLDINGVDLNLRGSRNVILVFNEDVSSDEIVVYSVRELKNFNSLGIRYIAPSVKVDPEYADIICAIGVQFGQILDPTLDLNTFYDEGDLDFSEEYNWIRMDYSHNGFKYHLSCMDNDLGSGATACFYDFTITLEANEGE